MICQRYADITIRLIWADKTTQVRPKKKTRNNKETLKFENKSEFVIKLLIKIVTMHSLTGGATCYLSSTMHVEVKDIRSLEDIRSHISKIKYFIHFQNDPRASLPDLGASVCGVCMFFPCSARVTSGLSWSPPSPT